MNQKNTIVNCLEYFEKKYPWVKRFEVIKGINGRIIHVKVQLSTPRGLSKDIEFIAKAKNKSVKIISNTTSMVVKCHKDDKYWLGFGIAVGLMRMLLKYKIGWKSFYNFIADAENMLFDRVPLPGDD